MGGGISFKTSFCKSGCSSLMMSFSLFVNVGVWLFLLKTSIIKLCIGFLNVIVFVHDNNMFSIISWIYNNVMFQVM